MMTRDTELPEAVAERPDVVAWQRRLKLDEVERTIRLAEVRCLPFDELLTRIERLWEDDAASEITYRACTNSLSHNQLLALAESVRRLAEAVDHLPSARKATTDRAVRRMMCRMPAEIAGPIVEHWLEHKRKFRREIAYQILRESGVSAELAPRLLAVFHRTADQECLKLLARSPEAVAAVGGASLVGIVDEEYWRMRVIQSLLLTDLATGVSLSSRYPREFVWAAGRQKDVTLLPCLRTLLNARVDDLDFLSLYAWALGQFGAVEELLRLRELMRQGGGHDTRIE